MGQRKERQVLLAAFLLAAFSAFVTSSLAQAIKANSSWTWLGTLGTLVFCSVLATLACLDIWRLTPADSHSVETLISQYLALIWLRIESPFVRHRLEKATGDPLKASTQTLMRILRQNQDTEYGRKYHFSEINSIEDFIKQHPVTTHNNYRAIMERIMAGEQNILYPEPSYFLASTSGTTGGAKVYPFRKDFVMHCRFAAHDIIQIYNLMSMMTMKRHFRFHIFSPVRRTTGNVPVGAGSQPILAFPKHNLMPEEYKKLTKEDASYYVMAVFALAEKELSYIDGYSPDLMHAFMKFMVKHWEDICRDIETGRIGKAIEIPEVIRAALSTELQADKERAEHLRETIKHGLVGLAKRVWPDLLFITTAKSAGFKMLATKLMENHFKGVKIIGPFHAATEGMMGLNLEERHELGEKGEVFTLLPDVCFLEFIPVENVEEENPQTVTIDKLQLGHEYEVVVTNENGLCRCRFGDIIRIVGYKNNTPKYEFMYKLGQRLNIAYERTPDSFLYQALKSASSDVDLQFSDFTTTESIVIEEITGGSSKGHYVYFIEFGENLESVSEMAEKIDQHLLQSYELYKRHRNVGSIGEVEIIQVKPGCMDGVKDLMTGGIANPQFKMPRVMRKEPIIRHLLNNRMA